MYAIEGCNLKSGGIQLTMNGQCYFIMKRMTKTIVFLSMLLCDSRPSMIQMTIVTARLNIWKLDLYFDGYFSATQILFTNQNGWCLNLYMVIID